MSDIKPESMAELFAGYNAGDPTGEKNRQAILDADKVEIPRWMHESLLEDAKAWRNHCAIIEQDNVEPVEGDYVLATKYDDGSPADHWGIGFYDGQRNERHYVLDGKGEQIRAGGFRRVGKIPEWLGYLLLKSANDLEANHAEENLWNIVNSITKDSTEPASKDLYVSIGWQISHAASGWGEQIISETEADSYFDRPKREIFVKG